MRKPLVLFFVTAALALPAGFQSSDYFKLRSVGTVQLSPDGARIAYTVNRSDGPRRPIGQLWIMTIADGKTICLSAGDEPSGNPEWSPDGKWIAYSGKVGDKSGLVIARPDGAEKKYLAPLEGTNAPLPTTGTHYEHSVDWSPDGKEIAFISNREPNEDQFFNYDLLTLSTATGEMRRL